MMLGANDVDLVKASFLLCVHRERIAFLRSGEESFDSAKNPIEAGGFRTCYAWIFRIMLKFSRKILAKNNVGTRWLATYFWLCWLRLDFRLHRRFRASITNLRIYLRARRE